jgi:hypothetical protein
MLLLATRLPKKQFGREILSKSRSKNGGIGKDNFSSENGSSNQN